MPDLSVLIPARNEIWLQRTIEDVLAHARADTEVIAVLDGYWPESPLPDHPKLRVTHSASVIGQRASTNLAASMSRARYVMKLDAHCSVDEGFDVKLIAADVELDRPDVTQIPAMYNLHAFNWKCMGCGTETYQGPTPTMCNVCAAKGTQGGPFERVVYWDLNAGGVPGKPRRSEFWRFDNELHFQYWHSYKNRAQANGDLVDVMSSVGAGVFMRRERFHALGGLDEGHGSWGQFGTEIACKSMLSGGRHIVNKRTWFAHLFRTQGGDFGFPYANPQSQVDKARDYSRKLWLESTWPQAKHSLAWLLEKFAPVPDWTSEQIAAILPVSHTTPLLPVPSRSGSAAVVATPAGPPPSKGLAYYTDNRGDEHVLQACRDQIRRASNGHQIAAVQIGQRRADGFGDRAMTLQLERGYLTMFKQILAALELLDTDIVFHVEHDVLYHSSHFEFTPPRDDVFYYNRNTWRIDASSGRALFFICDQLSGICAYRSLLLDHYRRRVAHVEQHGFDRNLGFEPGTSRRSRAAFGGISDWWMSEWPNVDIKTKFCLTPGRWSQDKFRNKNSCRGWTESAEVPGWGITAGRFQEWLSELGTESI